MVKMLNKPSVNIKFRTVDVPNPHGTDITEYWISRNDFVRLFFASECPQSFAFADFIVQFLHDRDGAESASPFKEHPKTSRRHGRAVQKKPKWKSLYFKNRKLMKMYTEMERDVTRRLAQELDGAVEVSVPYGRVDIVAESCIVEVKRLPLWKSAIGQILAYGVYFPGKELRIHLFGNKDLMDSMYVQKHEIEKICTQHSISVSYETCSAVFNP